jgi:hypothetical protein
MKKTLIPVKCVTVAAFIVTLLTTYFLRSEILELSRIRFSADNAQAEDHLREIKDSYPLRVAEHEVALKQYELQMGHYQEMLTLYRTDYDAYVRRLKDEYRPPELPQRPHKPRSPELTDRLAEINTAFRNQQYHYFDSTSRMNWVCCVSALTLVGGLLWLIMFDVESPRLLYVGVLILSFVFMIGPSFHSIISAIAGFLRAPAVY